MAHTDHSSIHYLHDFLYHQRDHHPLDKALNYRSADGKSWQSMSTDDIIDAVHRTAAGLLAAGYQPGDKIAMVAYTNRPEWTIVDFAMSITGIISVPLYPTISTSDYEYILQEAEVKAAFSGSGDLIDKLQQAQRSVSSLKEIYAMDPSSNVKHWKDIWVDPDQDVLAKARASIQPDDLATIIYTSGTTGLPKGVMLSHRNIIHAVLHTMPCLDVKAAEPVISFLPMCHIFERAVSMAYIYLGASVHYASTDALAGPDGAIATVRPVCFSTVPRLLEKIYEAIYNKGLALTGVKKRLFFWALSLTDDYEIGLSPKGLRSLQWKIADKLIFSKWREALGGRINLIITGAAPCPPKMMRIFNAAGIMIREGYGLTETSPTISINMPPVDQAMIGTVGPLIHGVEVVIDDPESTYRDGEGEILAHGPNVMMGYYKKPEENQKVFTEIDGKRYFRTGDIGRFVQNRFGTSCLEITDRKKELLKTSGGKYVAPAPIESRLKEDFLVEQVMIVGDKQKFVSALIVPAAEALRKYAADHDIAGTDVAELILDERIIKRYQDSIDQCNPEFSHIEQVKRFSLVPATWEATRDDGTAAELTPTMKLKRRVITEKCAEHIREMYR